jgi:hypothetical protein
MVCSLQLWGSKRLCLRLLEAPGVQAPLASLHSLLGFTQ